MSPDRLTPAVEEALREARDFWAHIGGTRRLWARDATLWTGSGEEQWLGWLDLPEQGEAALRQIEEVAAEVRRGGISDVVVLGMGGSSLCPYVLGTIFDMPQDCPRMHVLDSTDPEQVRELESRLVMARTLFIVASKSGSTLEPNIMRDHFLAAVRAKVGYERAGRHFIAITDPGSKLEREAGSDGFRAVIPGIPSVGGRFSALSPFGLLPAAVMGIDIRRLLERARLMARACSPDAAAADNHGVTLGLAIAAAARRGRDKLTLVLSPRIVHFGAWLEQLIAESTGKHGVVVLPVDREPDGTPDVYGRDRVFVYIRLAQEPDERQERTVEAFEAAGFPVIRIHLDGPYAMGAEFFRWEFATAVAGSVLGINPFDQPDVEASKVETRRLTDAVEAAGALPAEQPFLSAGGMDFFADERNAADLLAAATERSPAGLLRAHLDRLVAGDYFALLAYLPMNDANEATLQRMRHRVRDARQVATTMGFGPRYLHSTGQAYKGGPNNGVFLQVTRASLQDLPVEGRRYSFGVVQAAQARGDFAVLSARGRRALRIHLPSADAESLAALDAAFENALGR